MIAPNSRLTWLVVAALTVATLAVFWPVTGHEFINFDDGIYVYNNSRVKAGFTLEGFRWAFTSMEYSNWHPLTWLSLMLDVRLFGVAAGGHHLVNLLLHLTTTILLFLVWRAYTSALWPSALLACLFAVHPLHVESVAWVAERKDVLSTLLWVLTMACYLGYLRRPGRLRYGCLLLVFSLGLLAKPMLVTLPFVLLLLDGWPLGRLDMLVGRRSGHPWPLGRLDMPVGWRSGHPWPLGRLDMPVGRRSGHPPLGWLGRRGGADRASSPLFRGRPAFRSLLLEKWPLLLLAAASGTVTYIAQERGGSVSLPAMLPFGYRLANALVSWAAYIVKMVWPSGLAVLYPHPGKEIPLWRPAAAAAFLAAVSALVLLAARRRPYALTGWLWYLGTLVPVIGLVQVGTQAMADRYTYVPLIGLFLVIAWLLRDISPKRPRLRFTAGLATAVALLCLMALARRQVGFWRDSITLLRRTLALTSNNVIAHNNLGNALLEKGDLEDAIREYRQVLRFDPTNAGIRYNLAFAMDKMGNSDEALRHYEAAIRYDPKLVEAHNNLGIAYARSGRLEEAIARYRDAIRLNPHHPSASYNLGISLARLGRKDEALAALEESLRVNPDDPDAHDNLGHILKERGLLAEAAGHYRESLRLRPGSSATHNNLGTVLAEMGDLAEALPHFEMALRLDPGNLGARANLEKVLAAPRGVPGGMGR